MATRIPSPRRPATSHLNTAARPRPRSRVAGVLLALGASLALMAPAHPAPAKSAAAKKEKAPAFTYAQHPEAMRFADELARQEGWDPRWTRQQIGQAERLPRVQQLILPAPSPAAKNWNAYRARFVEPTRIAAGVRFWQEHHETLARAQARYGVPAELVVGIIGVETLYGRHTGGFRTLDALATLAFDFPAAHPRAAARADYFRGELAELLRLSRREDMPARQWQGSYAGAMGLPQFMPTSLAKFGIDFDGDGKVDLARSPADAIGSVAHYLQAYGWQTGMPTHYPVRLAQPGEDGPALDLEGLLAPDILPSFGATAFEAKGARLDETGRQHAGLLALVQLLNGDEAADGQPPSYVAGTENFYAVTRYNWSSYYAMAVIELGQAVARAMGLPR